MNWIKTSRRDSIISCICDLVHNTMDNLNVQYVQEVVTYNIKWVTTSWTDSSTYLSRIWDWNQEYLLRFQESN